MKKSAALLVIFITVAVAGIAQPVVVEKPKDVLANDPIYGIYRNDKYASIQYGRMIDVLTDCMANKFEASLNLTSVQKEHCCDIIKETLNNNKILVDKNLIGNGKVPILNSASAQKELNEKLKGLFTHTQYVKYESMNCKVEMSVNENGWQGRF